MGGCVLCINLVVCIGAAWAQHRTNTETRTHMCRVTTPNNARGYRYRTWPSNNKLPGHQQSVRHCCSPGRIPPWKKKKKAQRKNSDCHTMAKVYNIIIYILALYGNKRLASTHTHTHVDEGKMFECDGWMAGARGPPPKISAQQQQQSAREVRNENAPTAIVSLTFFPFFFFLWPRNSLAYAAAAAAAAAVVSV